MQVEPGPRREAQRADGPGHREEHAGGRRERHAVGAEDDHDGRRADARADRQLGEEDHRDQHRGGVEDGGVDAERVQHEPVARDLRRTPRRARAR